MAERPVITCEQVDVGYGDGDAVLRDVNLTIEQREITTIVGGSGSGKSTLLKAMVGLLPPLAGNVRLLGHDIYACSTSERSAILRRIGMLFQQGALFGSMTVLDNVMLPLRELTDLPEPVMQEMAYAKLSLVELPELAHRYPAEISGGQRKRVALARASVLDPEVVFCDEPTSGLDPIVADSIDANLLRLRATLGITIIAVTHDITSVRHISDHCVILGRGGVLAHGPVAALEHSTDPLVRAFFGRESLPGRFAARATSTPE
jgi:phospholipid/cholesterol/gamma-HCH transport system ATP-binding protein